VERYVQMGLLAREDVHLHPDANLITRAVGASEPLYLDCDMAELRAGDRYLLSSDGLDKHVSATEIAQGLRQPDLQRAVDQLVDLALERGGTDNVSACLVEISGDDPGAR
jgi:serine/threonine protein phosphatase PrpC